MIGYIYGLFYQGNLIDQTSLDEKNLELAEELFYGEFGHEKTRLHKVELIDEQEEE